MNVVNPLQEDLTIAKNTVTPQTLEFENLTSMSNYQSAALLLNKNSEIINVEPEEQEEEPSSEIYKAYRSVLEPHKYPSKPTPSNPIEGILSLPSGHGHRRETMDKTLSEINGCDANRNGNSKKYNDDEGLTVPQQPMFNINDVHTVENLEDEGLTQEIGCADIFPEQNLGNFEAINGNDLMGNDEDLTSEQDEGNLLNLSGNCDVLDLTNHQNAPMDMANSSASFNVIEEDGSGDCSNVMRKLSRNKKKGGTGPDLLNSERNEGMGMFRKTRAGFKEESLMKQSDDALDKGRRIPPNRRSKMGH